MLFVLFHPISLGLQAEAGVLMELVTVPLQNRPVIDIL